jgi:hypothetical protein
VLSSSFDVLVTHLLIVVSLGSAFRQLAPEYAPAFVIMGAVVLGSSALTALVNIKGHAALFYGKDDAPKQTLAVPEKLDDSDAEINL